ncbi:MAG: hypothetical protein HGA45_36490, partial [Chloroflexales bacterium]|nr:hypothetical protein [Chloroflexales bacterium]
AAIQRDLVARLTQAAAALRGHAGLAGSGTWSTRALLLPVLIEPPLLPEHKAARPSFSVRLARWWRNLTQSEAEPARPSLIGAPPPLPSAFPRLSEPPRAMPDTPAIVETPIAPAPSPEALGDEPPAPTVAPDESIALPPKAAIAHNGARVAITCFGPFRAIIDDKPVERWESSRARTIFKYLVVRNAAPVSKELLAGLFWPESEPDLARRSLHQAIYCLRQSLKRVAPDLALIRFADDCYQIRPEIGLWVDSEEFTRAIGEARARLASGDQVEAMAAYGVAADLVHGEFLEEERYEAWAEELRQAYRAMYSEALHSLARHYHERGEHATAMLHCKRILAQEPCDEEAHLLLMRSYVAQGLRHLAVRQYQICANALRTELGLTPSEDLESFYRRVVAVE